MIKLYFYSLIYSHNTYKKRRICHGKVARYRLNNSRRYTLINYFDVWRNGDEWIVNDSFPEFDDLYISKNATDKEILTYLTEKRYLATNDMRKVRIENLGDGMEVYLVKGHMPLFGIVSTVFCD